MRLDQPGIAMTPAGLVVKPALPGDCIRTIHDLRLRVSVVIDVIDVGFRV